MLFSVWFVVLKNATDVFDALFFCYVELMAFVREEQQANLAFRLHQITRNLELLNFQTNDIQSPNCRFERDEINLCNFSNVFIF